MLIIKPIASNLAKNIRYLIKDLQPKLQNKLQLALRSQFQGISRKVASNDMFGQEVGLCQWEGAPKMADFLSFWASYVKGTGGIPVRFHIGI